MRLSVLVLSVLPLLGLSLASAPEAFADGAPAAAPAATAQQVVDKVQAFYDKTTSFQADFDQEFTATLHNKKTSSAGSVTFVKPGKMSWRYSTPAGNRIVSDGAKLRVYEQANQQMFEAPVDKAQYSAALTYLTGQGKLWDTFNFEHKTGEEMKFPGGYALIGTPKTPSPAYKKVLFYVDGATYQVRRVMILDNQGSKDRFDFKSPRINATVPDSEFVFTPPPNTSIVKP